MMENKQYIDVLNKIGKILEDADDLLNKSKDLNELDIRFKVFAGKKGQLTEILRKIHSYAEEEKRIIGSKSNEIKKKIEEIYKNRRNELADIKQKKDINTCRVDLTIPGNYIEKPHKHPITAVLEDVVDFFSYMGFEVVSGPEIETAHYNFDALNIPADHPARDMWDTFYLLNGLIPRTHTSSVQARIMEEKSPPFRVIAPGRCYRYEAVDATHLFMFNQMEGLFVDKHVRLTDLKGILEEAVRYLLGAKKIRFRPAFYPFVEPGLDLDIRCIFCGGKGCSVCKDTGWIEVIPCGMVHPNVFKYAGIDPSEYRGFAFGMGFDRIVMLKYNINDLRLLYQGNLDVLNQF
ncbi:phenylalanine--tRNA ligase subunit alpha [Candidatus Acidulodesulfobacterium sp. H_13]|uniref:phenylalanine--tRNA ligase subunit alpha n=1 Tax=Candidatus Acidulodesulfobacterium sp. H_13 TaxID=3395470 RepID=UPI003AF46E63